VAEIRLLLDADVAKPLAAPLRSRGYDVVHAVEVGLRTVTDDRILDVAVAQGRTVLTHNVALAHRYAAEGRHHWGIILAKQEAFRVLLRRILTLLARHRAEDLRDTTTWLPP
jgi:predicted nuclease of predicted toxin-antitoxin system